jgi:dTDP-4-amino-4,6-dideoxygalactose transaminase
VNDLTIAAIGVEHLKKLPEFIKARKANFRAWTSGFVLAS